VELYVRDHERAEKEHQKKRHWNDDQAQDTETNMFGQKADKKKEPIDS